MSASQPETDRENEALKRAQRSHEASMDEILASIRAIIADDKANAATLPTRPAPAAGPQVIYSSFGQPKPVEPTPPPATRETAPQPLAPTVVWSRPDDENDHDPDAGAFSDASEQPLLSDAADRAISRSFETLAASLAMPSPERIEELAREQLRPMLKAWMDENLPSLVERLVRAEIQRVARGGR